MGDPIASVPKGHPNYIGQIGAEAKANAGYWGNSPRPTEPRARISEAELKDSLRRAKDEFAPKDYERHLKSLSDTYGIPYEQMVQTFESVGGRLPGKEETPPQNRPHETIADYGSRPEAPGFRSQTREEAGVQADPNPFARTEEQRVRDMGQPANRMPEVPRGQTQERTQAQPTDHMKQIYESRQWGSPEEFGRYYARNYGTSAELESYISSMSGDNFFTQRR